MSEDEVFQVVVTGKCWRPRKVGDKICRLYFPSEQVLTFERKHLSLSCMEPAPAEIVGDASHKRTADALAEMKEAQRAREAEARRRKAEQNRPVHEVVRDAAMAAAQVSAEMSHDQEASPPRKRRTTGSWTQADVKA